MPTAKKCEPVATRVSEEFIRRLLKVLLPIWCPIGRLITFLLMWGQLGKISPLVNSKYFYEKRLGKTSLSQKPRLQWSLLGTYDWLTPRYDNPQTRQTVSAWASDARLKQIEVENAGHLVLRAVK